MVRSEDGINQMENGEGNSIEIGCSEGNKTVMYLFLFILKVSKK